MKNIIYFIPICLVLILSTESYCNAQTTHFHYKYTYDVNGNRETRIYLGTVLKSAVSGETVNFDEKLPLVENTSFGEIRIYPNPTKGNLIIEFPEMSATQIRLSIYNLSGKEILVKNTSSNSILQLDLSQFPPGMYIMKVAAGEESSSWKVIKD